MTEPRYTRPEKHSLTLGGHRTSVSLEPAFWHAFRALAARQGLPLNALAAQIDRARGAEAGLASAIRLYVLHHLSADADAGRSPPLPEGSDGPRAPGADPEG